MPNKRIAGLLVLCGGLALCAAAQEKKPEPAPTVASVLEKQLSLGHSISAEMRRAADATRDARTLRRLLADRRQAANGALVARIAAMDAEVARIAGGGVGGRGGRGGQGGDAASPLPNLASVSNLLGAALNVAESADRTPPASAYAISQLASRDLSALLTNWKTLRDTKLAELNHELQQNNLPAIELAQPGN